MHIEQVYHAARVVAAESALLALLCESDAFGDQAADGVTVTAQRRRDGVISVDLTYTLAGMPISGEGV